MDTQTSPSGFAQRLRARPVLTGGVVVAALGVPGLVWFWFHPQALLFDDVVDEAPPMVDVRAGEDAPQPDSEDEEDVGAADTVMIWCLRFTVGFGAADLVAA